MVDQADMTGTRRLSPSVTTTARSAPEFLDNVRRCDRAQRRPALQVLVGELHESDTGDLIEALDADLRPRFVELLGREFDFTALTEVEDTVREEILEDLPAQTVAEGVRDLDSDDAAHILEDLPQQEQAEILAADATARAQRGRAHPALSGRIRRPADADRVHRGAAVVDRRRRHRPHARDRRSAGAFFELYVVDEGRKLLGAVGLDRLLRTKRPVPLADLMDPDRRRVRATDDQEAVARMFERYNLVAAPVVDDGERLVGVLTFDDIVDVIEEEAEEDIRALGGVTRDEELADSVWRIARGRFNWLLVNLATAFLASSVLGLFEGSLEKMVALAVLAPIVASQGGNATTQTMTVAVRALATRELTDANAWRVIVRELLVGLVNGIAFAVITGVAAWAWFKVPGLGIVIGLAMMCNMLAAALGGILIPLGLNRLRVDPAVASSPFVTTVTDVVGFFAFLAIATLWFGLK